MAGFREGNPAGLTPASAATDTASIFADARIVADDVPSVTPLNAAAAALMGNAAGIYATVADGSVTLTHAAAAGGEQFYVSVVPRTAP